MHIWLALCICVYVCHQVSLTGSLINLSLSVGPVVLCCQGDGNQGSLVRTVRVDLTVILAHLGSPHIVMLLLPKQLLLSIKLMIW